MERLKRYKRTSPLARDLDVCVIAHWAMPRFPDGVRLDESERTFVSQEVCQLLTGAIAIHNWHIPPDVTKGRQKGPDFNIIFSNVIEVGGILTLLRDRGHSLWGEFAKTMNYCVSELNLHRIRKGLPVIPTMDQIRKERHQANNRLYLCEQLACLPHPPSTVSEITCGLGNLGYEIRETQTADVGRVRRRIRTSIDIGANKNHQGFLVSLSGLVQEVALTLHLRHAKNKKLSLPTIEQPAIAVSAAPAADISSEFDWSDEDAFLSSLSRQARIKDLQLQAIRNVEDLFAALGLQWNANTYTDTADLRQGSNTITLPGYRPQFVLHSEGIRTELRTQGVTVPMSAKTTTPVAEPEQRRIRTFIHLIKFNGQLWKQARAKLKDKWVESVFDWEWSGIAKEPDVLNRAKRLHEALVKRGKLERTEAIRIVLAVCDPLGSQLGTIGFKTLDMERADASGHSLIGPAKCGPGSSPISPPVGSTNNLNASATARIADHIPAAVGAQSLESKCLSQTSKSLAAPDKGQAVVIPMIAADAFDWANEETLLASLARQAIMHDDHMRSISKTKDKFAALGLTWQEDYHAGTAQLSRDSNTLVITNYRPLFVLQSAGMRAELGKLGLTIPIPIPTDDIIRDEEHCAARDFTHQAALRDGLWHETRKKLRRPKVKAALQSIWSTLAEYSDEFARSQCLFRVLKQTGELNRIEIIRVVLSVCDPLGRRLGSIGPELWHPRSPMHRDRPYSHPTR